MTIDVNAIVAATAQAAGAAGRPVALHEPQFSARERELLVQCLDSGWVSSAGPFVDEFEKRLAAVCAANHAVAVVNGTEAIHVALYLAGVGAAHYCGAVPHFVDSTEHGLGLDAEKLDAHLQRIAARRDGALVNRDTGRPIRAILPVHIL